MAPLTIATLDTIQQLATPIPPPSALTLSHLSLALNPAMSMKNPTTTPFTNTSYQIVKLIIALVPEGVSTSQPRTTKTISSANLKAVFLTFSLKKLNGNLSMYTDPTKIAMAEIIP